ncbi:MULTISPECIES: 3-hydroxyacyl-CoA dehydrogenase/enoyl-CoA hydratase family protein [Halobacterium]|uniref:3-hydroxyacyl-CoA dehydrogenase/enoyl-CoA hydratase family protein n=1 Tax=Halobacterium TaxID=2239 RepID=UPI0019662E7A|nr:MULTISPECIES: 3-hydroxyacyl-CoA dehydrogenase/enoyl-CoA hydratase family protein [Halobacterium]MDL0123483.1 3-hydroxyacyl-CoA dehydrogenase NAD-binding domain-containing protein [Halobacterium salinarum]QRY25784.1 3-hydroxyacyl-CoA dehydrogenase/enoyl-CoA hydratase family protein [Halobacterium sp. BOL4-2]
MDVDDIHSIAVLGAGNMGHGIAEVAAMAGYTVRLRDISAELVQDGYDQIEWSLGKLAESDQLTEAAADAALDRISTHVEVSDAVDDVDVVIEAVPEKMGIKTDVYTEVEAHAPADAVFATNTSSLSITDLSEVTERPARFCGMHFFNPPVRMELVEVISGAHTDDAVLECIESLAADFGKTPVRVRKDSPGFVVNRILVPLLNEAAWLVHDDEATIAEVDSTTKYDMGLPMGAFELADQVGIDVSHDVLDYMQDVLGTAYEPCPVLVEHAEAGDLGRKSGAGFYDYGDDAAGADVPTDAIRADIADRLTAVMANEVAKLVGGGVADPAEIDEAVMLGAGYPEGPAKMADAAGITHLHETLVAAHEATGQARYEPADTLAEMAAAGESFHGRGDEDADGRREFDSVSVSVDGSVGHIELDRPHRMNTISGELLADLSDAIDVLGDDDDVRAVLLTGAGEKAFSAGADVTSMAGNADPVEAVELSRMGQQTFGKLEAADEPVVAAIDGYCLGGGMELATCADMRLASERSELGQPEHDLGLLPGWGGTQRLKHIVGEGRAKEIIFTADRFAPETLADYGFINEVVTTEAFEERAWELARDLAAGPPVAMKYTKRAMRAGRDDTDAGLEIEAQSFGQLMNTQDLMEGVSAFSADREPEFNGE